MSVTHPENLAFAVPEYKMDQIVDIVEDSFNVGAGVDDGFGFITAANATHQASVLDNKMYYTKGLWSHDGGASWQEMGNALIVGTASGSGLLTLSVDVNGVNGQGLYIFANNSGTSGYTIHYKIILMARQDMEAIGVAALERPLRYDSKEKYMKVFMEGKVVLPTGTSDTAINHNLGYIPNVNVWYESQDLFDPFDRWISAGSPRDYVHTSQLVLTGNSNAFQTYTAHYRIYLDD